MLKRRLWSAIAGGFALAAGTAALTAIPAAPAPSAPPSAVTPWLALAAYSGSVIEPERLCYWDVVDQRWLAADSDQAIERRKEDPRPVFREPNRGIGRCGTSIPPVDIGTLAAVLGTFVYIAAHDERGRREPVSPD